ncbi:MAG: MFS transporter [Chitinophagaceae bacterium]|nr:MFS transporter [Chitinophagaceae bacterium]
MNNWKRTFAIIWTGQFFSILSSSIANFGIIIWLSIETGSAETLAYAAIAGLLPQSLLGPFSGVFIDRWDRKKTMILADGFIAICTLGISLMFFFKSIELWYIYLLLALRSVGTAFHMPAMQASVPLLAPESELLRIAGINQSIQSVSNIAGPALAALALGMMDIGVLLLFDVAGAGFAIVSLLFVNIPNPKKETEDRGRLSDIFREMRLGIKEITRLRGIALIFFFSMLVMFCIMPVAVIFPLMTLEHFKGTTFQMSMIEAAWGVGMLLGGLLVGVIKWPFNKALAINLMHVILGSTLALSGMLPPSGYLLFVVLTGLGGAAATVYQSCFTAIIQQKLNPAMLGRVFSLYFSISFLPSLLGLLGTGFLADAVGLPLTFIALGGLIVLIGLLCFGIPEITAMGRDENSDEENAGSAPENPVT